MSFPLKVKSRIDIKYLITLIVWSQNHLFLCFVKRRTVGSFTISGMINRMSILWSAINIINTIWWVIFTSDRRLPALHLQVTCRIVTPSGMPIAAIQVPFNRWQKELWMLLSSRSTFSQTDNTLRCVPKIFAKIHKGISIIVLESTPFFSITVIDDHKAT